MDVEMRGRMYALELLTTQLISEYLRTVPDAAAQTKWARGHLHEAAETLMVETESLSSDSLIVTQMAVSFVVEVIDAEGDGGIELVDGSKGLVREEVSFEIPPGALDVVQFGRVFRQPFDGQPWSFVEGRAGQLADMDRPIIEDQDHRLCGPSGGWPIERLEALQQGNEIGAALGSAAMDDQLAGGMIEHAQQRQLARLAGGGHPQVSAALGPGVGQIGMGQRLGLVGRQQHDVAGVGLLLQQLEPEPGAVYGVGILPAVQTVPGPAPSEAVFFSALLSWDLEIDTSLCRAISACKRGKVQLARSATGALSNPSTTADAASLLSGSRPPRSPARRPSTPSAANQLRHRRMLSGVTPKARAIWPLVQPLSDSTIARARSASSRRSERANPCNPRSCSALDTTRGCPTMIRSTHRDQPPQSYDMWHSQVNPA
jgi:hypothetical protein